MDTQTRKVRVQVGREWVEKEIKIKPLIAGASLKDFLAPKPDQLSETDSSNDLDEDAYKDQAEDFRA